MPPAATPPADLADRKVTLENTSRNVLLFQFVDLKGPMKKPVVKRHLRIGDAADREPHIPGQRDDNLQPNPIVDVTGAELQALGAEQCKVLLHYVNNGTLRVVSGSIDLIRQIASA